jgi:hypothetical protein
LRGSGFWFSLVGCPSEGGADVRNHDEKTKDLVESVLPSSGRQSARVNRRLAHARHRTRQRDQLTALHHDPSGDFDPSLEVRRRVDLAEMVYGRRCADKTSSIERWAVHRARTDAALRLLPVEQQLVALAGVLPNNLMGRHAIAHMRWALERHRTARPPLRTPTAGEEEHLAATRAALHLILTRGLHADFNRAIRDLLRDQSADPLPPRIPTWHRPYVVPDRLLHGVHDIDEFLTAHRHPANPLHRIAADLASGRSAGAGRNRLPIRS